MEESNYFSGIKSLSGLTRRYRTLAKKYHPDVTGDADDTIMQEINRQFSAMRAEFERAELRRKQESANNEYSQKQYERERSMNNQQQETYSPPPQDVVFTPSPKQQTTTGSVMSKIGAAVGGFMKGISINFEMPVAGGFRVEVKK